MSTDKREQGAVDCLIEDGLATVTFFHPSHNSLPGKILAKLANTITELGTNDAVKLILLKSAGDRTFCAGASFDELIAISNLEEGKKFFMGFANVINAMRKCPKLIIGRVQGKAVGGGVGVAGASGTGSGAGSGGQAITAGALSSTGIFGSLYQGLTAVAPDTNATGQQAGKTTPCSKGVYWAQQA